MTNPALKVVIAWMLLVPLVAYNIRSAFAVYRADAKLWKLLVHTVALICFGVLIVDLGVFCLRITYDLAPVYKSQFSSPKLTAQRAQAAVKPARTAAAAKPKPGPKK